MPKIIGGSLEEHRERTREIIQIPFSLSANKFNLEKWLSVADPRLVEDLEKACRKLNPWLLADMSVEDIDREIESLKEMREEAAKREAGE